MTYDAVIVGAGIVGAACAASLSSSGLKVVVIDGKGIATGTTAAGMGHIVVMDDSEPQFQLCAYSQHLWREAADEMPANVEWSGCGTLWVAADAEEMREVERKHRYLTERGVSAAILDGTALADAEPNLRRGLAGGLLQPEDSVIYAPCAAAWLLRRAGSDVRLHARVLHLRRHIVSIAAGPEISAGLIVLATGDSVRDFVEVGYVKSAGGENMQSVAFNVQPRPTGQILIGSSRQYGVETADVNPPILAKMLRRSIEYMPGLADLSVIRTWTGFRAATPDKLPVIGPHPEIEDVWIAAGHEGLGITMAPGAARVLADAALGRAPEIPLEPFLPRRFLEAKQHA
jgi:glycine/D-amino acid oxidase-like deaminating enzyme